MSTVWVRSVIASDFRLHFWLAKLLMNCLQQAAFGSTPLCAMWRKLQPPLLLQALVSRQASAATLPYIQIPQICSSSWQSSGRASLCCLDYTGLCACGPLPSLAIGLLGDQTAHRGRQFSAQRMGQKDFHHIVRSCSVSLPNNSHCDLRNTRPDSSPR